MSKISKILLSRAVNRLRLEAGNYVSTENMVDAIWYDREDGGPLNCKVYLCGIIFQLRMMGFPIINQNGFGYRYAPEIFPDTGGTLCNEGQKFRNHIRDRHPMPHLLEHQPEYVDL